MDSLFSKTTVHRLSSGCHRHGRDADNFPLALVGQPHWVRVQSLDGNHRVTGGGGDGIVVSVELCIEVFARRRFAAKSTRCAFVFDDRTVTGPFAFVRSP